VGRAIGYEPMPFHREVWEHYLAAAREPTDPARWQAAYEEGTLTPIDGTVGYALR
jgi:hypothetical protein